MLVVGLIVLGYNPHPRMVVGFGKCTGSQSPTAALPVFAKSFLPFYWYNTTNLSTTLASFTNQPNGLGMTCPYLLVQTSKLVMGDIDVLLYNYCHEQISPLSRLLPTNEKH